MNASIKLRLGNLFDGPSDLIVLPCSTMGTITGFVARALANHSLPHPNKRMQLGDVEIMPFIGGETLAQHVAFAASVQGMGSSIEAIESIGRNLGNFTKHESSARRIAAPLLGTGAGGLRSEGVVAALRRGFLDSAAPDSSLIIHVLFPEVYDRLKGNRPKLTGRLASSPRVFISHTSTSPEQIDWVKELALFLIDHGIQARLDKFHLRRGMDLPQWMSNELQMAAKVIVVSDETYKQKADGRLGGVGWETMIIQGDLANLPPESTKYQIVIRSNELSDGLPAYLKTKYVFHAPPSDTVLSFRDELVRELLDLPMDERLDAREVVI